jgi:hypothetical protein
MSKPPEFYFASCDLLFFVRVVYQHLMFFGPALALPPPHKCTHSRQSMHGTRLTLHPFCAAGTAKGPIPAIASIITSPSPSSPTRRVCSFSRREFQYT